MRACSCRDVGAGGNGSRLPVRTWHGTWGMSHAAGCALQAARRYVCVLLGFGKARLLVWKKLLGRVEKTGAS